MAAAIALAPRSAASPYRSSLKWWRASSSASTMPAAPPSSVVVGRGFCRTKPFSVSRANASNCPDVGRRCSYRGSSST
jgi:hypothetical protein